ncbi:MAG: prepilin-type N-terminal cleavage/methylation domain-containing protein [Planctomycetia bacterium]|nr:prepilin-type N-terminal cleavage/methylation domain-containing protein [Planctomycetia bacterium]MBL6914755.1 prepilin-type N-terminal cleavage/methylation domain-containing protein [Planctomycetota bacterium]
MKKSEAGLTLIEILVALGIFMMLGSSLVMFLRDGMSTWQIGESRREAYERAGAIMDLIGEDLRSSFTQSDPGPDNGLVDVLMLCDMDDFNRPRLRLVRTLSDETRNPVTRIAGSYTGGLAEVDYRNDSQEAKLGILRAPGGLAEVAYLMGPESGSEVLWRGMKSPIGGESSLFDVVNLLPDVDGIPMRCRPVADGVLYLAWSFWGGDRRRWSDGKSQQALPYWDSTRGILEPPADAGIAWDARSRDRHEDDVFPDTAEILLVLNPSRSRALARLTTDIGDDDDVLILDSVNEYSTNGQLHIRLDSEWILVGEIQGNRFVDCQRGVRGTKAVEHLRGTRAVSGTEFRRTIRIPGYRDARGPR